MTSRRRCTTKFAPPYLHVGAQQLSSDCHWDEKPVQHRLFFPLPFQLPSQPGTFRSSDCAGAEKHKHHSLRAICSFPRPPRRAFPIHPSTNAASSEHPTGNASHQRHISSHRAASPSRKCERQEPSAALVLGPDQRQSSTSLKAITFSRRPQSLFRVCCAGEQRGSLLLIPFRLEIPDSGSCSSKHVFPEPACG